MKERQIIAKAHEVLAILDGRKTQTRRVAKYNPFLGEPEQWGDRAKNQEPEFVRIAGDYRRFCPNGQPGDRLWVKETFSAWSGGQTECGEEWDCIEGPLHNYDPKHGVLRPPTIEYRATRKYAYAGKWRSPLFLPRWASRITLELVNVRVERVQDISEADAMAEGCQPVFKDHLGNYRTPHGHCGEYHMIWNSIHGKNPARCWEANPWTWVLEFKRVKP